MKNTFRFLMIICLSIFSCSKTTSPLNEKYYIHNSWLKGEVKSIETKLFEFKLLNDSIIIGQRINDFDFDSYSLKEFNNEGLIIFEKTNESKIKYFYDSSKKLVKRTESFKNDEFPSVIYKYKYNEQDSLTKIIYRNRGYKRTMVIERDNKNRGVKRTDYVNDTIQMIFEVKYDFAGNIIEENKYLNKSKPLKFIKRNYNEINLLITEDIQEFRQYDSLNYKNIYKYNNNSKIVEIKRNYVNDSDYTDVLKKYNSAGKLIMEQWIPKGNRYSVTTTEIFDEYGNTIEFSRKSNDESMDDVWTSKYKYDEKENWIEKQKFKNNKPVVIVKREIEYY